MGIKKEFVQKVDSHYVGNECVQVMMGYRGCMLLLNPNGLIYHDQENCDYINKYLDDDRRNQFPYSNIPYHNQRVGFRKYKYVNQLLEYDTPYLRLTPNGYIESYALKDGKQALVVSKTCFHDDEQELLLSRQELENLFALSTDEKEKKLIIYGGDVRGGLQLPTDDMLVRNYQANAQNDIKFMLNTANTYSSAEYNYRSFTNLIDNAGIESIPENHKFMADNVTIIKMNGEEITLQNATVRFMGPDKFAVYIEDLPVNSYTLDQVKSKITKAKVSKEPKINPRLNHEIAQEEVVKAKSLIKQIKYGGFKEATGGLVN